MRQKLFTLFLVLATSVGTIFADGTKIGDLYYNLDAGNLTAEVTYQERWSDNNYSGLTSANIPSSVTYNSQTYSVTSIGYAAFRACSSLTSVTIPNSVTSIGVGAFWECSGLTSIIVESGNSMYDSRDNCNAIIETSTNTLIAGCQNTVIPNSVTSIGSAAFQYCRSLTSVTIPSSVTSIGGAAFYSCSSLTSVTIPNSVTSIGEVAFAFCTSLTSIDIPSSVTSIGWGAFSSCSSLTSITIPNSVTLIGQSAFYDCTSLASVTIPNSVTSIEEYAFAGCSSLTSVTIPNSVTSIGEYAFQDCSSLTSVYNYATTPQAINCNVFEEVNKNTCTLYVPEESIELYRAANGWKEFENILPIAAEVVETESTTVETSETTAEITWPEVSGAYTYELTIRDKNGNIVCTLIFNANGQLTQIAFGTPARDHSIQTSGFSFTVTSLEAGTSYDLTITAKDENGEVLQTTTQSFTTADVPSAVENVTTGDTRPRKQMINGQLIIIRDGRTYTVQGQPLQ